MSHVPNEPAQSDRLEAFLKDVDPALIESLKRDERRRRRKLVVLTLIGGLIMGSTIAIICFMVLAPHLPVSAKEADQSLALAADGWQMLQSGKADEAAAKFEKAVELDPSSANALNGLGWAKFNAGDMTAAQKAFERCLTIQHDHPAALNGLGQIAYSRSDFNAAEEYFLTAAGKAPAAQVGLAKLYLLQGKYDQAAKYAQAAADAPGADDFVRNLLSAAKAKQLDPRLKKLIQPIPALSSSEDAGGWSLLNRGELNQARELFADIVRKNPNDIDALNGLGFALVNLGKAAEAKAYFERCLQIDPDAAGPRNGLALCLKAEGKTDEAIEQWLKMADRPPVPNAGTTGLAMTYFEQKQYDKALPYLQKLVEAMPDNEQFKEMLVKAQAK